MSQNYLLFLNILFIVYSNTDTQNQSSVVRNVVMTSTFPNERFVATFEPPATPGGEIRQYRIYLVRRFAASFCDATFNLTCSNCNDTTVGSAGGNLPTTCNNVVNGPFNKTNTTIRITSGDPNIPSATVYDVTFEAGNAWGWGTVFTDKLTSGHYKSEVVQNYNFTIINKTSNLFYTTFQVPINENGKSAGYILRVTPSNDINKCLYGRFFNCTDCSGYTIGYEESFDMNCSGYYKVVDIKESNKTVEYQDNLPFQLDHMNYTATVYAQNGYGWGAPDNAPIYIIPIDISVDNLQVKRSQSSYTITFNKPSNSQCTLYGIYLWITPIQQTDSCVLRTYFNISSYHPEYLYSMPCVNGIAVTMKSGNPSSISYSVTLSPNNYTLNVQPLCSAGWGKLSTKHFSVPQDQNCSSVLAELNTFSRKISFNGLYGNCFISVLQGPECIYMVLNLSSRCNILSSNPIGQTIIPTYCTQVSVSVSYSGQSSYVYVPSSFNCAWPSYTLQLQVYTSKWCNPITTYPVGGVFILIIIIFLIVIIILMAIFIRKYQKNIKQRCDNENQDQADKNDNQQQADKNDNQQQADKNDNQHQGDKNKITEKKK